MQLARHAAAITKPAHQPFRSLTRAAALRRQVSVRRFSTAASPSVLLSRPSHEMPAATWHLRPGAAGTSDNTTAPGITGAKLSEEQARQYFEDGFLVLPGFFADRLPGLQDDVEGLIDALANKLHASGEVESKYEGASWTERLMRLTADYPDAPIVLAKAGVLPQQFQQLYADPRMLDIASQLGVGPEVAVNAAWNLRAKMPAHEETTVPWVSMSNLNPTPTLSPPFSF